MESLRALLENALPLKVLRFQLNDPIVNLSGESWFLTVTCPWTISRPNGYFTWESEDLEHKIPGLIGLSMVGVECDNDELIDPVFVFDDGSRILVFADSALDPWTLGLPGIVLIGMMAPPA